MAWLGVNHPEITMQYGFTRCPVEVWLDVQLDNRLVQLTLRCEQMLKLTLKEIVMAKDAEEMCESRAKKGEVIGGGYFVFRRGKRTGRIGVRKNTLPFEHGTFEAAAFEAKRLRDTNPGESFAVFEEIQCYDSENDGLAHLD